MVAMDAEHMLKELLDGLSDREVAELCTAALRQWRRTRPTERMASMHGTLGLHVAPLLCERRKATGDPLLLKEPFASTAQNEPWMRPVMDFVWALVRRGFIYPLQLSQGGQLLSFQLTGDGERLFSTDADHPLVPGFLERAKGRVPQLGDAVVAHLADAHACWDRGLLRASVSLLGLAYETGIDEIASAMLTAGLLSNVEEKAAKRIAQLRASIGKPTGNDPRWSTLAALDFADLLRERRNEAAHPRPTLPFDDAAEVEEFLISAARHLPGLYLLHPESTRGSVTP